MERIADTKSRPGVAEAAEGRGLEQQVLKQAFEASLMQFGDCICEF